MNNPNDKPKERHGCGIERNIKENAYSRDGITEKIVFVTVSDKNNESNWP
jgi:hypothetical protein